jgi:hypothetical protein
MCVSCSATRAAPCVADLLNPERNHFSAKRQIGDSDSLALQKENADLRKPVLAGQSASPTK